MLRGAMSRKFPAVISVLLCSAVLPACGEDSADGRALRVVATTPQVADFVRSAGGRRVVVHQILRPNADPHGFEPRPSDARELTRAKLVFKSGGDVDEWLGDLIENAGGDAKVVELIDSVETLEDGRETDPHWWEDPRNAALAVSAVREALVEADPAGGETYRRNARLYLARLHRLDRGIATCMAKVPTGRRKLVTTHDAFGYFAKRYDVEIVGALIPSLSTQAQPSAKGIERLVGQIRSERVKAIFPETALDAKLEQAVSRETGAKVGRALWADSLGPRGSSGATYLEAMAFNAEVMVDGMTGGTASCRPNRLSPD
jgi:zinc/manganese transport system substrate-binding protein